MNSRGISLANKCQLLFGMAVLLILTAALAVPWIRLPKMIDEGEREIARQLADAWLQNVIELGTIPQTSAAMTAPAIKAEPGDTSSPPESSQLQLEVLRIADASFRAERNPGLLRHALGVFKTIDNTQHAEPIFDVEHPIGKPIRYRFIKPLYLSDMIKVQDPQFTIYDVEMADTSRVDPLWGVLIIERRALSAVGQLRINRMYIILAGLFAGALAVLVFYFITTRLILSPVHVLREVAERVSKGDLHVRSDISTGDEFESLSNTFNGMLSRVKTSQDQLRQINKSLDLRLAELTKSNSMLLEANRLKSEFLANVSHELRTPLNSIIGFAEVIESQGDDQSPTKTQLQKIDRYAHNIRISGIDLLQIINDLLDLAKIEAGRMELQPEPVSIADVCEALTTLMKPQSEKKQLQVRIHISPTIPVIETDAIKIQQILFNFLSNAIKFTPPAGHISIRAERYHSRDRKEMIKISVTDTGPGISGKDQEMIFDKFRQVDASHTRQYKGTGLGLAICKDLSHLLGGNIGINSTLGNGATFYIDLPIKMEIETPQSLMN